MNLWKERKLAKACLREYNVDSLAEKIKYIRSLKGFWTDNFQHVSEEEIKRLEKRRPTTRLLSIHTINGCNLACRACNHNSSLLSANSKIDIDQLLVYLTLLNPLITYGYLNTSEISHELFNR